MPANKKKHDAFARLADWLENGAQPLDEEIGESLADEAYEEENAAEKTIPSVEVKKQTPKKKKRQERHRRKRRDTLTVGAYADAWWYRVTAFIVCVSLVGLLLYGVVRMPLFGNADTLADSEVASFYVTHTLEETGAVNIVTGIILDYRGFDTLGESHVLFVAVSSVLLLLSIRGEKDEQDVRRNNSADAGHDAPEQAVVADETLNQFMHCSTQ